MALAVSGVLALASCHEGAPIPYTEDCFDDNYNAEVPFTFVVSEDMENAYTIQARGSETELVKRYTVWAYKDGATSPSFSFSSLSETPSATLPIGNYEFKVFCDYVDKDMPKDKYFFTDEVDEILVFKKSSYAAFTHYKHSFWGQTSAKIVYKNKPVRVELSSLMARIQYKATDAPSGYKPENIRITYLGKIPSAINGYNSDISYEWENVSYLHKIGDGHLSFDYVFADDAERTIPVMVEILDGEGAVKGRVQEIRVPIKRGGVTTVEGPFFSTLDDEPEPPVPSGGGVGIDTGFTSTVVFEV